MAEKELIVGLGIEMREAMEQLSLTDVLAPRVFSFSVVKLGSPFC